MLIILFISHICHIILFIDLVFSYSDKYFSIWFNLKFMVSVFCVGFVKICLRILDHMLVLQLFITQKRLCFSFNS